MQSAVPKGEGGMIAVLGSTVDVIEKITDIEIKKIEGSVSAKSSAVSKKATPVIEKSSEEEE